MAPGALTVIANYIRVPKYFRVTAKRGGSHIHAKHDDVDDRGGLSIRVSQIYPKNRNFEENNVVDVFLPHLTLKITLMPNKITKNKISRLHQHV